MSEVKGVYDLLESIENMLNAQQAEKQKEDRQKEKARIMAIRDPEERRKQIQQHLELFR